MRACRRVGSLSRWPEAAVAEAVRTIRPRPARKAAIDRAIKAVQGAGLTVASVEVLADGGVRVLTGPAQEAQRDDLEAWRARRDARKLAGA